MIMDMRRTPEICPVKNQTRHVALLVFCLCCMLSFRNRIPAQNNLTDSLESRLPGLRGADRMKALADLTWEWSNMNAERAVDYGRLYLTLAGHSGDSALVADAANLLAVALYRRGHYDEALTMNRRAYRIRKASGDLAQIGSSLNKFVNIYSDQIMLDSALHYGLESIRIFEQLGDSANLAISCNAVSGIYQKERDWETSRDYAARALELAEAIGFDYAMGGAAGNLGVSSEGLGLLNESITWYERAREAFTRVGSMADLATVANNLGFVYRRLGNTDAAMENYSLALRMAESLGESNGIAHYNANLGGLHNSRKEYNLARPLFDRALAIAESEHLGRIRLQCYDGLAEIAAFEGQPERAVQLFHRYNELKDSLYNEERSRSLSEMRAKYETEKKEKENAFLKTENHLKDRRNRAVLAGSAAALALLVLAGVFWYRGKRRSQEVKLQAEVIRERERGLAAVFDATEEERRRIARDLHDGIGQQLGGLQFGLEAIRSSLQNLPEQESRITALTEVVEDSAREVRNLSHQMMPRVLNEGGLLPALEDMLRKSLGISGIRFRIEHFRTEGERFPQRVETGVYRIAQELVSNIIRHSGATEVSIQLIRSSDRLVLVVEDNGRGFAPDRNQSGIGLLNITSRLATIRGEVTWEPGPERGTVATVRVPVSAS
jgi:signal transduction histidine kinase